MKELPAATHEGKITISGFDIPCYNLPGGERVLSRIGVLKAIGRTGKAKGGRKYDQESKLPVFLTANNLKPFISNELIEDSNPIIFKDLSGNEAIGYKAEILPSVCYVFLDAQKAKALRDNQIHIAERAEMLVRGFATVGIIALVDEATGYQYDREKQELQAILEAYISKELLEWQKRFPDNFYMEIFRLNGWPYTVSNIKKRPSVIGKWTNKLIYERLPKGVLSELKKITPKSESGNYTARFHQSLTQDIGNPDLQAQIFKVIGIMRISDNWKQFISNFNKMVQRESGQIELKFEDLEYKGEPKTVDKTSFNDALGALMKVPKPGKED